MAQQAQNDHYADERALALAYAEAVNEELRDLKAAGADVVQIDEPYLQARPEPAREYAVEAINRALDGDRGRRPCCTPASATRTSSTTGRSGYPFLARARATARRRRSRSRRLSRGSTRKCCAQLPGKTIVLGVLDLGASEVETPEVVADRIRGGARGTSRRSGSSSRPTAG